MKYRFYTCDVFTETRFGGNPLAVLPRADGLSDHQMQQITREFNYSETSFVFPATAGHTRAVRIFTPAREIPFAGHPNVGTAFVLAVAGELGAIGSSLTVTFEEKAGIVPVAIQEADGAITLCELEAPQPVSVGRALPVRLVAASASLSPEDIVVGPHGPQVASVGLPFVMVEVNDVATLARARVDLTALEGLAAEDVRPEIYLYTWSQDRSQIRSRLFAPLAGVPEDPATGSAACALAGLFASRDAQPTGSFRWRIVQGVEMGRPSTLLARAEKSDGMVKRTWVGGSCVLVTQGDIQVD